MLHLLRDMLSHACRPRRRQSRHSVWTRSVDPLEQRVLLSGANSAPTVSQAEGFNAILNFTVQDQEADGEYTVHIDRDGNGSFEYEESISPDMDLYMDLAGIIGVNTTEDVSIYVEEEYWDSQGNSYTQNSATVTVEVPGIVLTATPISSHNVVSNIVTGTLDWSGDVGGGVEIVAREAGSTTWTTAESTSDENFILLLNGSDGVKDFEVATRTTLDGVVMLSDIITIDSPPADSTSSTAESSTDDDDDMYAGDSSDDEDPYTGGEYDDNEDYMYMNPEEEEDDDLYS